MSSKEFPIRLVVGLGNPGAKYDGTRHNAGFWFVDRLERLHGGAFRQESKFHGLACRVHLGGRECWLLKPETFMNRSGAAVRALMDYYRIEAQEILVAHDELDFEPGSVKLKMGGGHGGHNGLRDILAHLGKADFARLRIGIGHPGDRNQVVDYVLKAPGQGDARAIEEAIERSTEVLPELLEGSWQRAVNRLHSGG
jgi:PTH1 family peptidyl-tRNA hydrolase